MGVKAPPKLRRQKCIRKGEHRPGSDRGFVVIHGERRYLGKWNDPKTHSTYHRLMANLAIHPDEPPVVEIETGEKLNLLTVTELCLAFLDHVEVYYRGPDGEQTSEVSNHILALRPLRAMFGPTPAEDFGPSCLLRLREHMVSLDWSRKYINKHVNRIRRMFKWAASKELLDASVWHSLKTVEGLKRGRSKARETGKVEPVPDDLIDPIEPFLSRQVWAMVQLQRLTGMRSGEIVSMRGCDIQRDIFTQDGQRVWVYEPARHKTSHHGHDRPIPLGPKCQAILKPFLDARDDHTPVFSPREAERERLIRQERARKTPRSCGNRSDHERRERALGKLRDAYTRDTYRRAITRAIKKAFPIPGQERTKGPEKNSEKTDCATRLEREKVLEWQKKHHWHPHRLRHSYATHIRKQFGLEASQVLLGHKSADITQLYAERDIALALTIAAKEG